MAYLRKELDRPGGVETLSCLQQPPGWLLLTLGIDQSGVAVILLDTSGSTRHIAPAAAAILERGKILNVQNGRIYLNRSEERGALRNALAAMGRAADAGQSRASNLVVLRDRQERTVMGLHVRPLLPPGLPPLLSLHVTDMTIPSEVDPVWITRVFGLTRAEAKVAAGLLDGLDLREIATRQDVALETVRGHLKRGMIKMGAHSQAQLVRLIASSQSL